MIRVVVADDMQASLQLLEAIFALEPGFEIAGRARDGRDAVELTQRLKPDLVTMDIQMPVMNGFDATLRIMTDCPTPIIVVSGQDVSSVGFALNAMKAGALAVVPKPVAPGAPGFEEQARHLLTMARAMAGVKLLPRVQPTRPGETAPGARAQRTRARVVAIAASTGGPPALSRILSELPADFRAPLLVVQHIAEGFAEGLAKWLGEASPLRVKVGEDGEPLAPGTVYLAPDRRHLGVKGDQVEVSDAAPIDGFKPSGTYLFESVARSFGPAALGLILTGMGRDGVQGLAALRAAGGTVVAQDKDSSVIFGMNGEAVLGGLTDEVLPLDAIAYLLMQAV
ncbi:chemotaxis-specific protein-glutamate methyltransferase CheB [Anaeromyxobacter sp. Fw109-5]|uniref:chemotaxis-specific protein-glutamate methyltransferase CheB n=1 Tax=Anaeromyxobacter sp. (strain Fw109-5) TaxID=404589 RepID=UPI0000ED74AB|nr:chemotaxis-specific protein-glutamate methyltransferase CheB [Anaeromyxobacter sp. Fw109-5]ABS26500.1 response regulator receiver modulated CheB methylesterase [Anaeromyxobacter sp. Fw109-5]